MPRMTVRVLAFMFLALAIGQAEAQRRLLASQKNYSTANIQNLQNYYGTGTKLPVTLTLSYRGGVVQASLRKSSLRFNECR